MHAITVNVTYHMFQYLAFRHDTCNIEDEHSLNRKALYKI